MARLNWTAEAERWLREIFHYIAEDDPDAARRVVQGIYDKTRVLADSPEIGYRHDAKTEKDVRVLLYGHYRIAYIVKSRDQVNILGVFHGAMDIERYF